MTDCSVNTENEYFRCRAGGFVVHGGSLLLVKSSVGDHSYVIGGGVHIGETSRDCAEREFFEETGVHARAKRLAVICENFFKGRGGSIDGRDCHTIEFYYILEPAEEDITRIRRRTDAGEELIWIPVSSIGSSDIRPGFLREGIARIIGEGGPLHLIEERDR